MQDRSMRSTPCRCRRLLVACGAALAVLGCAETVPVTQAPPTVLAYPPAPDEPRFFHERTIYSSADVVPDEAGADLRRFVTGEKRGADFLAKPYAVAVFRGRIFVSDTAARYVRMFDIPSGRYSKIGDQDGPGGLQKPIGLDVDGAGNLYVADITQRAILIYGPDGTFQRKVGEKTFVRLASVTVDADGKRLYAVDIGGVQSEQHMVRVFDAVTGEHLKDIGRRGSGPGEFNLPRDVAIGKYGRLYVVDGGNFRVVVFDAEGRYLQSFGSVGKQFGQFARPKEIAVDHDGNVYVVDAAFGNFQIFNPDGDLLLFVGDRSERDGPGKFMLPSGIAVDEDGRVYMVDQWFRKIEVFRPAALKPGDGYLGRKVPAAR
jgi:sugar lactone lactonase YvrE